jgi:hypothetical protein
LPCLKAAQASSPRKKLGHDANGKPKPTGALPQNTAMPIHIYCINQLAKRA